MPHKIVVAYDFNPVSDRALDWAADLARQTSASLVLLHVLLMPPPAIAPDAIIPVPMPSSEDQHTARARMQKLLETRGIVGEVDVSVGAQAGAAVVERARELGADMIVVGTHSRGALARAFMGSVASHIVHHAECPVVTLRDPHGSAR